MPAIAAPLPLSASEKKITRDGLRALNLTREAVVTATALLSAVSTRAYWTSLRDYATRMCATFDTGATGDPPGARRTAVRKRKTMAAGRAA